MAQPALHELPRPSIQPTISRMVLALLGATELHRKDLVAVLGVDASGVGEKLNGKRKWTPDDLDAMAAFFSGLLGQDIAPGIFFRPTAQVFDHQNWKLMTAPDLRIVEDLPKSKIGTRGVQLEVPFPTERTLHLVPDIE